MKVEARKKKNNTYVRAWRSVACYWHGVFIRSDNICLELRRLLGRREYRRLLKSTAALGRESGHSCAEMLSCSKGWKRNRSGERPTSRADPGTVPRYLLPCVPPPYAVIPKDRQACAIWPHFGFPGHILGIQTMPPPRASLPSVLSPSGSSLPLYFIPA